MQLSNIPSKWVLPFAYAGGKNSIPTASQIGITPAAASLTDGFPPLTRTAISAGGKGPSGLDMNGVLFELSTITRWATAGGGYTYDATFATDVNVNGYPIGARIMRTDGTGYWLNTVDNNTTDPESAGAAVAGWVPDFTSGVATVTMTSANVTLTPAQYGKPIIVIGGVLTANLNLIFPAIGQEWYVVNNTSGNFTVTCKTAAGTGVIVTQNGGARIYSDLTNIVLDKGSTQNQFDNSQNYSTTAFVQRALGNRSNITSYTSAATLTAANAGGVAYCSNGGYTLTLPAANSVSAGSSILFWGYTTSNVAIARAGTDTIRLGATSATSATLEVGGTLELVSDGSTTWSAVAGSASLPYSALFSASLGASGWQKLPSGLIVQFGGFTTSSSATTNVAFPIAFPNSVRAVLVSANATTPNFTTYNSPSSTSFNADTWSTSGTRVVIGNTYIAIGS